MPCDIAQICSATINAGGRLLRRHLRAEFFRRAAQHREGAVARLAQFRTGGERNAGLEHRRIVGRLGAGEFEIGFAQPVERGERVRAAVVPGPRQRRLELLEAAQRDAGQKLVAVAEMPIRRRRAHAGPARRFGKGEAGRPLLRDQFERGAKQRFFQIAVVIAARASSLSSFDQLM